MFSNLQIKFMQVGKRWTLTKVRRQSLSTEKQLLRFDRQTALITGAGRGLGREYALLFASRGANVVVNDFGGGKSGEESSETPSAAQHVVDEIKERFPNVRALANSESVESERGVKSLVESAIKEFGTVDILINNAGILKDKSFAKMTTNDWDQVINVHLRGSFLVTHACWPLMKKQRYGKIVLTSSTSGLYGNFGQANYSAAKMGLLGLGNTIAIEGARDGISCNVVVPMAASRMTRDLIPKDMYDRLSPALVAPIVAWLCHKDCRETGSLIEAAGGWYGRYSLYRNKGVYLPKVGNNEGKSSVEIVASSWKEIASFDDGKTRVSSFADHLAILSEIFFNQTEKSNDNNG